MNIILSVVAIIVVVAGVIITQITTKSSHTSETPEPSVSETPYTQNENDEKDTPKPKTTNFTSTPSPSKSPAPTVSAMQTVGDYDKYIYPNSDIISSLGSEFTLRSYDDPKVIADWYKNLIKNGDMNVKTFVQTNTNDKVLDKLVGVGNGLEIRVEISKEPTDSFSQIKLSVLSN